MAEPRTLRNTRFPTRRRAFGHVTHNCDSLDDALIGKVVEHIVLGATVVPHANRASAPTIANGELWALYPIGKEPKEAVAFHWTHFNDAPRKVLVDEQTLLRPVSGWNRTTG